MLRFFKALLVRDPMFLPFIGSLYGGSFLTIIGYVLWCVSKGGTPQPDCIRMTIAAGVSGIVFGWSFPRLLERSA